MLRLIYPCKYYHPAQNYNLLSIIFSFLPFTFPEVNNSLIASFIQFSLYPLPALPTSPKDFSIPGQVIYQLHSFQGDIPPKGIPIPFSLNRLLFRPAYHHESPFHSYLRSFLGLYPKWVPCSLGFHIIFFYGLQPHFVEAQYPVASSD